MRRRWIGFWLIAFFYSAVVSPIRADAQPAESGYFSGKTIRLVVGYSPGGGYDVYAHLLAPFLKRYLGANVIVDNEPGAGGLRALNDLYASPPDGLKIMIIKGNAAIMAQLMKEPAARYDLTKFGYLGGTGLSPDVWIDSPKIGITTVAQAQAYPGVLRWAGTGPMDGLSDGADIVCKALSLKCKVVLGYTGTSDAALALGRGEMDALITNEASANSFVRAKNARPVATLSTKRSRYFSDTPTIYEAAKLSPEARWWIDFRVNTDILGRILAAPPNMPPARLKALQDAVRQSLTDPQLIAEGAKSQHFVEFQDAKGIHETVLKVLEQTSPAEKSRIRQVVKMD